MNPTAKSKRAVLLSLISLVAMSVPGCSTTDGGRIVADTNNPTLESDASPIDTATESIASSAELPSEIPAASQALTELADIGVGIELMQGANGGEVVIKTASQHPEYEVSRLSGPDRVVIDLPATKIKTNRSVNTLGSPYVKSVRIGSHGNKSRIVLDLPGDSAIDHRAESRDGSVIVALSPSVASEAMARPSDAALSDSITSDGITSDSITAPILPVGGEADTGLPTDYSPTGPQLDEEAAPGDTTAASPETAGATVRSVRIETVGQSSNMVIADIDGAPGYELTKTAPSEFVLTLKGAGINPDATMALIASRGSGSIRSVRPSAQGDDVLLRVFVEPNSELVARQSGERLILENVMDVGAEAEGVRAQAKPPKAEDEAAEKAPASATPITMAGEETLPPSKDSGAAASNEVAKVSASDEELSEGDVASLLDDTSKYTGRLISLDLQDTDIDNALRIIAEVSHLNIIASDDVTGKVTLRLIDVPWDQALDVILKTNGLDKVQEGNVIRIAPVDKLRQEREALKQAMVAEEELEPLGVKYLRVSYARAAELRPLVETVLSERGTVAYDERSNQLIVKDVRKGLRNVVELVNKVDLRTPQVLLETQIVEASRTILRELGSSLGFNFVQSPSTGNATGYNFPNSIEIGGGLANNVASSFPSTANLLGGSAIGAIFGSADGTKQLDVRLSALEREGRARIISRPAVATTNNKAATIKSVEKIRIRLPDGGLSVATGSGASASGQASNATEIVELGITLDVTPQASPDYFVLLDINAKSSTFGTHPVDGIPSEVERSASSTVLVSSGQTFALGGIYKLSDNDQVEGTPFFKDIPFLGHLFRRANVSNSDEELLFFITPRIVEGSFDDAAMKANS